MTYVATVNTPGYLPDSTDEPPTFDTASAAWSYLADERRRDEDNATEIDEPGPDELPYSETVDALDAYASAGVTEGTVYGSTPGYDGSHDLGLAYTVTPVEL
jgi:hypothetical protein